MGFLLSKEKKKKKRNDRRKKGMDQYISDCGSCERKFAFNTNPFNYIFIDYIYIYIYILAETIVDFIIVNHFVQWGREKRDILLTRS